MTYEVVAPKFPGSAPSVIGRADKLTEARKIAREFSRGRKDLRGQDAYIRYADSGQIVRGERSVGLGG